MASTWGPDERRAEHSAALVKHHWSDWPLFALAASGPIWTLTYIIQVVYNSASISGLCICIKVLLIMENMLIYPSMLQLMTWLHWCEGLSSSEPVFWQISTLWGSHCTSLTSLECPSLMDEVTQYCTMGAWSSLGSVSKMACVDIIKFWIKNIVFLSLYCVLAKFYPLTKLAAVALESEVSAFLLIWRQSRCSSMFHRISCPLEQPPTTRLGLVGLNLEMRGCW